MIRSALLVLAVPLVARADAPADATALFEQGVKDLQAGNVEKACKELAASLAKYPDSGTKGALAECYQTLGKVASSWTLWKELADTAPSDDLKADAAANAQKLEPRLPKFTVKLAGTPEPGLIVTVNGSPVADPTLAVPLPIDPGPITVTAKAPGFKDWTAGKLTAYEGRITTIEVPKLIEAPKPVEIKPIQPTLPPTLVVHEDNAGTRHSRHVIGASFMIIGAAVTGGGAFFGSQAYAKWDDATAACSGQIHNCVNLAEGKNLADQARNKALLSTILFAAGGASIVIGGVVFLSAPSDERRTATSLRLTPTLTPGSIGVTLGGGFR